MKRRAASRQQGFTLIEVLIVVAIMGVLLTIAVPSFRSFMANQRVKTASFEFYAALSFARSEAIKRRQSVTVEPVSGNWANGWTVKVGTTTLRSQDSLTGVLMSGATSVAYRLDGRLTSASAIGVLVAPETSGSGISNRCIRIDLTGVPKSTTTTGSTCP